MAFYALGLNLTLNLKKAQGPYIYIYMIVIIYSTVFGLESPKTVRLKVLGWRFNLSLFPDSGVGLHGSSRLAESSLRQTERNVRV